MMASRVLIGTQARRILLLPLLRSVRAIAASLGPYGRPLLYEPKPGGVAITSDALTIAVEMAESEGARSIGPRILKETLFAAQRDHGDGSARLACILGSILEEGTKHIAAGHPPQQLADEIQRVGRRIEQRLAGQCCSKPELRKIASTVTEDCAIAEAATAAVEHAGADGFVTVKKHPQDDISVEIGNGFILDANLPSERLGPVRPATELELQDVFILVANDSISDFGPVGTILEGFATRKKSLGIIARDISGPALDALVRNRSELGLQVVALKPADVSTRAGDVLQDLAIATASTLIDSELGYSLRSIKPTMLGRAKRLSFAKGRAVFAEPAGDRISIEQRRKWLSMEAEKARHLAYDREHLLRRSARLAGTWSQISVGGRNEFDSSVKLGEATATIAVLQAALKSGVVAGGGTVLVREAWRLRSEAVNASAVERAACLCVARGLESVLTCIVGNAGIYFTIPMQQLQDATSRSIAFNVRTGRMGEVAAEGIADPLSITVGIVACAISAAATLLRVEALICR